MTEERLKEIEGQHAADLLSIEHMRLIYGNVLYPKSINNIPDLVAALREARGWLGALTAGDPSCDCIDDVICAFCFADHFGPHNPDCPWLLAKQYLALAEKEL